MMSRSPTRFEVIAAAYPLHAQQIAENCFQHDPDFFEDFMTEPVFERHDAIAVLRGAFLFDFTPEGHDYWSRLARTS